MQVASWTRSGDFSGWSTTHKFALFNELTQDRPWLGSMYLAAVYSKALSPAEINQNRTAFLGGDCASGGDHAAPTFSGVPANLTVGCGAIPPAPAVCNDVTTNYASSVYYQNGIVDASHSLGAPDGQDAQFYDSGDRIEWTFGSVLPAGTEVCVTWRRRDYTATTPDPVNAKAYIWEISGGSYYQTEVLVTASTSYITKCFTLSYACDRVKIKNHGDAVDFEVDAIGYRELNCAAGEIVVSDNCDLLPSVVFNESTGVCSGGSYAVTRTWTATDAVGNSATATQVITVIDNEAPVLSGAPGDLTADCGAIPAADVLTAIDGCGGQVCTVQGYHNGSYRRSLWLPLSGLNANYVWVGGTGNFEVYDNGTAHLTGTVQNKDNASCGWEVDVWFSGAYDWATWSAMGRTYKPGPGTTGTIYETWTYYEVDGSRSTLTGTGCFAGDVLNLTNKPSDFSMGLQIGTGANDMDATYGMSFWFYYTGTIYGATASGNGDFNLEGGCVGSENAGLNYEYWTSSSNISSLSSFFATAGTPAKTGITPNAQNADHLAIRTVHEKYVIRWTGAIEIPTTGDYTFFTKSDDGSRLYIDGVLVVNNDGLHAALEMSGTRHLTAGCHTIEIQFFENTGSEVMETRWQGPGIAKQLIPNSAFKTSCSVTSGTSVPVVFNETVGTCASGSYEIVRTWTATDACGNSSSHTQTITVTDTEAPVLSMEPANISLNCNDPLPPVPAITASDNCDMDVTVQFTEVTVAGVLERTWTATDDCGNTTSYTQLIGLNPDLTKPVLSGVPSDETVDCGSIPAAAMVTAMDDCDGPVMVTLNETYGPGPDACRTINRTWTATDAAGNSISATQIITVLDNIAPNLVGVPDNLNLNCGEPAPAPPAVIALDNCGGSVSVIFSETTSAGVITRTWTATDACGNSASAMQTIGLNPDNTPPVIIGVPANITVECGHEPAADTLTAADDCDGTVAVLFSEVIDDAGCGKVTTRTWTATDAAGNTVTATQIITSVDTKAPWFSGQPANRTVYCNAIPAVSTTIRANDDCDGLVPLTFSQLEEPSLTGCYDIVREWLAVDQCGNDKTWTQRITVLDTVAPVLSGVPANVVLACGQAIPDAATVAANDDCSGALSAVLNETSAGNVITRTWTATDACGNTASASQVITVNTDLVIANVTVTAATSCTVSNGVVVIDLDNASAGTGPYTVTINGSFVLGPFASEPMVISNAPGGATINSILVEDAGGCQGSSMQTYSIGEPELEILTVAVNDANCTSGLGSVVIDLDDAKAGMPPYRVKIGSVIYGPFASEPIMVHLAPGSYTAVAVRDNKGCFDQKPGTITIDPAIGCGECLPPSGTGEVVNGRHTVDLFWNLVIDATGYLVSIREVGTTDFLEIPVADLSKRVGGLEPCTSYEWCVRAICGGTLSDCSPLRTFTTSCDGAPRVGEVDLLESDVFPNPTAAAINLSITLGKVAELSLEIYDVTGMLIHAEQAGQTDSYQARFDLSGRAPGVYLAKWQVNGESVLEKFVYTAE